MCWKQLGGGGLHLLWEITEIVLKWSLFYIYTCPVDPWSAARCNAVLPSASIALIFAPFNTRNSQAMTEPLKIRTKFMKIQTISGLNCLGGGTVNFFATVPTMINIIYFTVLPSNRLVYHWTSRWDMKINPIAVSSQR